MTRKDYHVIGKVFSAQVDATRARRARVSSRRLGEAIGHELNAIEATALKLAHALRRDNPRFEEWRFMEACGFAREQERRDQADAGVQLAGEYGAYLRRRCLYRNTETDAQSMRRGREDFANGIA